MKKSTVAINKLKWVICSGFLIYNTQTCSSSKQNCWKLFSSLRFDMGRDSDSLEDQPANHLLNQSAACQTQRETELPWATLAFLPRGPENKWRLSVLCDWGMLQGCSQSPTAAFQRTLTLWGPNQLEKPCSVPPHITVHREPWRICWKLSPNIFPWHWEGLSVSLFVHSINRC